MTGSFHICDRARLGLPATKKGGAPKRTALIIPHRCRLGRRCDILGSTLFARLAHAAARTRRFALAVVIADADGGGKDAKRDTLLAFGRLRGVAARARGALAAFGTLGTGRLLLALGAFAAVRTVALGGALSTVAAIGAVATRAVVAVEAFRTVALRAVAARLVLAVAVAARRGALLVVAVVLSVAVGAGTFLVAIVVVIVAARALVLLFEARAAFLEDAEIMIGELEIIFGLDTVTGQLHVARQCLVLFEQLGGIAALPIVLAIAIRTAGNTLGTLSTAAATAPALTIVDQDSQSLSHRAVALPR